MIRRTTLAAASAAAVLLGGGLALAVPASASSTGYPTPTATPTQPTPTPTPPVVNPFARCAFTRTLEVTFDPTRGRDVFRTVPSITCDGPGRQVTVYTLAGNPGR